MRFVRRIFQWLRWPLDMMVVMITPTCSRIVREASENEDGAQPSGFQRFYIQIHMMCCRVCDNYIRNVRVLGQALERISGQSVKPDARPDAEAELPADLGPGLSESARNRLVEHLKNHRPG
ncbi:MAG: hypothetical protein NXI24_09795 [bacterium]|nr:hypothetical protein [bacterium]